MCVTQKINVHTYSHYEAVNSIEYTLCSKVCTENVEIIFLDSNK